MGKRKKILLVVIALSGLVVSCFIILIVWSSLVINPPIFLETPDVQVAKYFISDLAMGKEPDTTHLSPRLKAEIQKRCPNASILGCTNGYAYCGKLDSIYFGHGEPTIDTVLYYEYCGHDPIAIVLIIKNNNGNWEIGGWRGFVPSQGEDKDSELIDGRRHDNEFP